MVDNFWMSTTTDKYVIYEFHTLTESLDERKKQNSLFLENKPLRLQSSFKKPLTYDKSWFI